jgi:uncharacterized protein YbjT (DUF2867 family)
MKILITNPTGNVGRRILTELLAPEFSVRVIARKPSRLPVDIRGQVEVVQGSTDDCATLRRALNGVEALFWCVPNASLREVNVRAYYERAAAAGSQAIRKAGIARVVTISASGKVLGRSAGPISGLHAMEEVLNQSGAAIRHLRCGWFMENFLRQAKDICGRGVLSYPVPGQAAMPMAAAKDVADIALKLLVRRDWTGIKGVPVCGPQEFSFDQAAAIMERVLERPVRYNEVSADEYIRHLVRSGASVHYARSVAAMFAALARGVLCDGTHRAEPNTSTTLTAWTMSELLPLVKAPLLRWQPNAAFDGGNAQPVISALPYGGSLQWLSVSRAFPSTHWECWAGEGI